jgi:glutamate-ammonia-ligase adenylyltransferase
LEALSALHSADFLSASDYEMFSESYRFLRTIESRLRLMHTTSRDDLPSDSFELARLAHALAYSDGAEFLSDVDRTTRRVRERYEQFLAETTHAA